MVTKNIFDKESTPFKPLTRKQILGDLAISRQQIANAMTLDLLTDPQNRNLARELTLRPENREKLTAMIKDGLAEKNIFVKNDVSKVTNKAAEFMKDPENRRNISERFLKNMQAQKKAARG